MGNVSHGSICSETSMTTLPFCHVHWPRSTTDSLGSLRQVSQHFRASCSHLCHKENIPVVVTGILQTIKSEGLRRCGRCFVSVVLMFVLSLSLLCFGPPLHTCGSKPVQPGVQICPIPSISLCPGGRCDAPHGHERECSLR